MAKPLSTTTFSTDTNFSSGTETGTPTKVDPGAGYRAQGFVPGNRFIGPYLNYVLNLLCQWIVYLDGITSDAQFLGSTFNWTGPHTFIRSTAGDALQATGNTSGAGLNGTGGTSAGPGVRGIGGGLNGTGVIGSSTGGGSGHGAYGVSSGGTGNGVRGECDNSNGAVRGLNTSSGPGVHGSSSSGPGLSGTSTTGPGATCVGGTSQPGVIGQGGGGNSGGVEGLASGTGVGAYGESPTGAAVFGVATTGGVGTSAGGWFKGPPSPIGKALVVESSNSDSPHIQLVTGISAAPSGMGNGSFWLAGSDVYIRSGASTFSFEAGGLYKDGVLIA